MALSARNTRLRDVLCQRQKTKSAGKVDMVLGMFLLLLIVLIVLYEGRLQAIKLAGDTVEDALAGALLAAAVTDVETYGRSGEIAIKDATQAYHIFADALRHNLCLDGGDYSTNDTLLYGKAEIADFRLYHVVGDTVIEQIVTAGQVLPTKELGKIGDAKTPDGVCIENTTVYGKVLFSVEGLLYGEVLSDKEKSVDIVRNEEMENETK